MSGGFFRVILPILPIVVRSKSFRMGCLQIFAFQWWITDSTLCCAGYVGWSGHSVLEQTGKAVEISEVRSGIGSSGSVFQSVDIYVLVLGVFDDAYKCGFFFLCFLLKFWRIRIQGNGWKWRNYWFDSLVIPCLKF